MKNISIIIIIQVLLAAGCSENLNKEGNILSVSILPQKYFAEQIAGPDYKINVLIPPGASPASYEPSPRQMQELANSDVYLRIGEIAFEKTWIRKYQDSNPGLPFFNVSKGIELIYSEHDHEEEDGHEEHETHRHEGADPHVWMSPENARIIAKNTFEALSETYPSDADHFLEGYKGLLQTIDEIDSLFEIHLPALREKEFLIYHPALTYLARDYGMKQHVLEFEGKEPPPSHIAKIIETARKHGIEFIFVQKQFSSDNAKSLSGEIGAKVISIDPLNENWPEEMKTILNHLIQ
ncbi:MAG: metal ABC transporter solute-binding protein, Zn/Mn family [Bacteroidota bacterium]